MPLTQNFAATQVLGEPSIIVLTDSSTGSDAAISSRKVYITNAANEYITASGVTTAVAFTTWAYADSSTEIDCLTADTACNIRVDWVNSGGTVLYTKTTLYGFYSYTNDFLLQLTKNQVADPSIIQDTVYWGNKAKLHTLLKDATNAVSVGGDITSAQNSLNAAEFLIQNSSDYF